MIELLKKTLVNRLSGDVFIEDLKVLPNEEGISMECILSDKGRGKSLKATISRAEIFKAVEDAMVGMLKQKLVIENE